jgi:hypothetical protein
MSISVRCNVTARLMRVSIPAAISEWVGWFTVHEEGVNVGTFGGGDTRLRMASNRTFIRAT